MSMLSSIRQLFQTNAQSEAVEEAPTEEVKSSAVINPAVPIAPNDPLMGYMLGNPAAFEIDKLKLDSPALNAMKNEGVKIAVPLVSQGELVGVMSLGARLSEQEYSVDDRRLLNSLASQAAPALRVAQLARQQQAEAAERERIEQELRVARIIQQTLLPQELPQIPGWALGAYWQPARAIGGDFYDFIELENGHLCVIAADVTDKGVPAALVMASARSILRAAAERLQNPGEILERVNNTLCPDIPPKMFITCLCLVIDPESGIVTYANAGHNLPAIRTADDVLEIKARGMPLGLMPGMQYEEVSVTMAHGDAMLLYSDGIDEAHNPSGEMFGFPRLLRVIREHDNASSIINRLLRELKVFTGPDWEQEDDVTFVLIRRTNNAVPTRPIDNNLDLIEEFSIGSAPGNERQAMDQVASLLAEDPFEQLKFEQLKTAVAEATMNAMEHGNKYREDIPVLIQVCRSLEAVHVLITDQGSETVKPTTVLPDLDAKLAGNQSPRGWGLFLIENMVDEMNIIDDEFGHTIELVFNLNGGSHE